MRGSTEMLTDDILEDDGSSGCVKEDTEHLLLDSAPIGNAQGQRQDTACDPGDSRGVGGSALSPKLLTGGIARERFERERLEREQLATQNAGANITPLLPVEQRTQQRVDRPMIASDNMPEVILPPASLPPRIIETAPIPSAPLQAGPPQGLLPSVIVAADPAQTPHPAPANSIYDQRTPGAITQASHNATHQPSPGSIRPSETGLLPLAP